MACEVRILPTALKELDSIVVYLSDVSPAAASRFLDEWDKALERLRSVELEFALCRFEPLAKLGYRLFKVSSYIALYYREGEDAVIAHVFHQSRDYASLVGI